MSFLNFCPFSFDSLKFFKNIDEYLHVWVFFVDEKVDIEQMSKIMETK